MAEALLTDLSDGKFIGYSAGSHPGGRVNPFAIEKVKQTGYPLENLRSKSWHEFAGPSAPQMDFIITVCDNAAGEVSPLWRGRPATAHWSCEDPEAVEGTDEEKRMAFAKVFRQMALKVLAFIDLPDDLLGRQVLHQEIKRIGSMQV